MSTTGDTPSTPQRTAERFTCSHCPATWTGQSRAHCAGEESILIPLAVWDGNPRLLAQGNTHLHQRSVHSGRVPAQLFADLVGATSGRVQPRRVRPPVNVPVNSSVLDGGKWTQVLWSIVGPMVVEVVNVLMVGNEAVDNPVFVGFDVLTPTYTPAESNVSVASSVPARLIRRDFLSRGKPTSRTSVSTAPARLTESPLSGPSDGLATHGTRLRDHELSLQVTALCHRTFSTAGLFDLHRAASGDHGGCKDPATITDQSGQRLLFLRDGLWRGPEMTADQKAARWGGEAA